MRQHLVRILSEPKNALVKQYQKLLEMDNVKLGIRSQQHLMRLPRKRSSAIQVRADLRAIIEGIMLDVMYEVPSRDDVSSCLITEKVVQEKIMPELDN